MDKRYLRETVIEIAKADFAFACKAIGDSMRDCSYAMDELGTEIRLLLKDDPFNDDGSPDKDLMASYAAADEAAESLALISARKP